MKEKITERGSITQNIIDLIDLGWNLDDIAEDLYNDESNFNNADITSGQRCYSYTEIEEQVNKVLEELRADEDRCSNCGMSLEDSEQVVDANTSEYWGTPVTEYVVVEVICKNCGERNV